MKNLTFSEYIRSLDSRTVLEHLLDGKSEGVIGEAVYLQVEEKYLSDIAFSERWKALGEDLQGLLFKIYLCNTEGFPVKEIEDNAQRMTLLQSFFVYEGTRSGESYLLGFVDIVDRIIALVSDDISLGSEGVTLHRDEGILCDSALLISLVKDGIIKRRQDGLLQKNSIEQFLQGSVLQLHLQGKKKISVEPFLELLLSHLSKIDVIRYDPEGFYLAPEGEERWRRSLSDFSEKIIEQASELARFTKLPVFSSFITHAGAVSKSDIAEWESDLAEVLLIWCGEVVADTDSVGIGTEPIPKVTTAGHIMPDFSVMIPREIDPRELLLFFEIGVIESVDVIYKGNVTKDSVVNALSRGVQGEYLLDTFKRWNASPHLLHTVQEWIYSFERVFVDGHYLAMSETVAEHLTLTPEMQDAITEVPAYRFFRITPGRELEIKNTLEKMGFDTRFPNAQEIRKVEHNRSNLELSFPVKPDYSPELSRKDPVQTNFGRYGGALKKCNAGELLKVVRYAIFMDENLAVLLENESEPVIMTPTDIKTGDSGELSGKDEEGNSISFSLSSIDKIGVVSDS